MRLLPLAVLSAILLSSLAIAQTRTAPKKAPTLPEALDQATKAAESEQYGTAIAALQAAIKLLQKKQRVAILASLPKPQGWEIQDDEPNEATDALTAGLAGIGTNIQRRYHKADDKSLTVDVMANSPMLQMIAMLFNNPAMITAEGGEIVQYGPHKAILKKSGDNGSELQILMHEKHLVKVTAQGITAEELLQIFDQAFVDRMEKPLGK